MMMIWLLSIFRPVPFCLPFIALFILLFCLFLFKFIFWGSYLGMYLGWSFRLVLMVGHITYTNMAGWLDGWMDEIFTGCMNGMEWTDG